MGDLDGDDDLDLAVANRISHDVSVLINDGTGTFAPPAQYPTGFEHFFVAVADFDGDGDLDLVTDDSLRVRASVLSNTGDGTFGAAVDFPTGASSAAMAVGDLDDDGDLDLVTANLDADTVSVLLNTTATDTVAPTITINTPSDGATYGLNAPVSASYACNDGSGSGVASCAGPVPDGAPIDTTTPGPHSFTVIASDVAGNQATLTHTYTVTYTFEGFLAPIDDPPTINTVKAGRSIPVKWRLNDANGIPISDPASFTSLTSAPIACTGGNAGVPEEAATRTGLTHLGGGAWLYDWKTARTYAGTCRLLTLTLADGTNHAALFRFK